MIKRQSLDLTNWERAHEKVREWEIQGFVEPIEGGSDRTLLSQRSLVHSEPSSDNQFRIDDAIERFFVHLHSRDLSPATIKKNRVVIGKQLAAFCRDRGFLFSGAAGN